MIQAYPNVVEVGVGGCEGLGRREDARGNQEGGFHGDGQAATRATSVASPSVFYLFLAFRGLHEMAYCRTAS